MSTVKDQDITAESEKQIDPEPQNGDVALGVFKDIHYSDHATNDRKLLKTIDIRLMTLL